MTSEQYSKAVLEVVKDLPNSFKFPVCVFCEQILDGLSYEAVLQAVKELTEDVIKPGLALMTLEEYARHHNKRG